MFSELRNEMQTQYNNGIKLYDKYPKGDFFEILYNEPNKYHNTIDKDIKKYLDIYVNPGVDYTTHNGIPDINIKQTETELNKTYTYNDDGYKQFIKISFIKVSRVTERLYMYFIKVEDFVENNTDSYFMYAYNPLQCITKTLNMMDTFREYVNGVLQYPTNIHKNNCLYRQKNENNNYTTFNLPESCIWGTHIRSNCTIDVFNRFINNLDLKNVCVWDRKCSYYEINLYKKEK